MGSWEQRASFLKLEGFLRTFCGYFLKRKASSSTKCEVFSGKKTPVGCEHPRAPRGTSLNFFKQAPRNQQGSIIRQSLRFRGV